MDAPSAIPKYIEHQLKPLRDRIEELERQVAELQPAGPAPAAPPSVFKRLGLSFGG